MKSRKESDGRLTPEEMEEFMALQQELEETRAQYGVKKKEGRLSRLISDFFDRQENREKVAVYKKKYLILALLAGWMGGHRFYARQWPTAFLYLALFWTGFPFAMTLIDLMIVIPKEADEEGKIFI